jgi:hypothetical protein
LENRHWIASFFDGDSHNQGASRLCHRTANRESSRIFQIQCGCHNTHDTEPVHSAHCQQTKARGRKMAQFWTACGGPLPSCSKR